ncbi:MAG: RpiB/LacA/LacB family sugar-phosphate isomerase [Flavobacteriales bacterium]
MRVSIGGDHAGPALKKSLTTYLESLNYEVVNRGTDSTESVDYPDHAHAVAMDVESGDVDFGILICGSANGVAMSANKHQGVRAGLAWNAEVAQLVKQHNNANVLCIPARFVTEDEGLDILKAYMEMEFEGGRHERRVQKIACAVVASILMCLPFSWLSAQDGELISDPVPYAESISAADLENHLMVLASDAFEGRETGEPGAEKAAAYIASHFAALGIAPYDGSTYYQPVDLVRSQILGGSASVSGEALTFLDDYLFYPGLKKEAFVQTPMMVIGNVTQLAEVDIKGHAVVVRADEVDGETRWQSGLNDIRTAAAEAGAAAVIVVGNDISLIRSRMKPWLTRKSIRLNREEPEDREGTRIPTFMVDASVTDSWWKGSAIKSWKKWSKTLAKGQTIDPMLLPSADWNFQLNAETEEVEGKNVLGFIPGRDSILRDEVLVITAHYDHVGIIDGEIYNGADDDGSGTVTVLELAEAFMEAVKAGQGPRRSVLLMTVVGEEKGLLGSEWYADHAIWPLENTVANLNIDMIGRVDENHTDDNRYVYLIGSDKLSSELHEISETANSTYTNLALDYTFNAPDDPNRFYYRSDHYNFAKNNIPVIFYFSGVHEDYHRPGDDPEKIMYDKTAEIGQLVFYTAWQLANQDKRIEVDRVNDFPTKQ